LSLFGRAFWDNGRLATASLRSSVMHAGREAVSARRKRQFESDSAVLTIAATTVRDGKPLRPALGSPQQMLLRCPASLV
jgi:hypothetical protein